MLYNHNPSPHQSFHNDLEMPPPNMYQCGVSEKYGGLRNQNHGPMKHQNQPHGRPKYRRALSQDIFPEISLGRHRPDLRGAAVRDLCRPLCRAPGASTSGTPAKYGGNAMGQQPRRPGTCVWGIWLSKNMEILDIV